MDCLLQLGLGVKEGAPLLFFNQADWAEHKKGLRARASLPGSNALKLHCTAAARGTASTPPRGRQINDDLFFAPTLSQK